MEKLLSQLSWIEGYDKDLQLKVRTSVASNFKVSLLEEKTEQTIKCVMSKVVGRPFLKDVLGLLNDCIHEEQCVWALTLTLVDFESKDTQQQWLDFISQVFTGKVVKINGENEFYKEISDLSVYWQKEKRNISTEQNSLLVQLVKPQKNIQAVLETSDLRYGHLIVKELKRDRYLKEDVKASTAINSSRVIVTLNLPEDEGLIERSISIAYRVANQFKISIKVYK